jgi:D-3-phosphoglycerate dehydrogenase
MAKKIVQVMTHPFGASGDKPRRVLEGQGWEIRYNPYERRLKSNEVPGLVRDAHGIIAGTEQYTPEVMEAAKNLRVISRVGVGLDNIPFDICRDRDIAVTFTPEAPADGAAELTVGQILNLLRKTHESDKSIREGAWNRYLGFLIREVKIGVLGVGRIGKRVVKLLSSFQPELFGCDLKPDIEFGEEHNLRWVAKEELFERCHLVTIHVPLNKTNYHLVGAAEMEKMPPGSCLVNLARGGIVDEASLIEALKSRQLSGAAIDVFEDEPYEGPLTRFENVILTAHMGASAHQSRYLMELGAAEDCVRVLSGESPVSPVTEADLDD